NNTTTYLSSAEVYDPVQNSWTSAGTLHVARSQHTATVLSTGKVLVAGGWNGVNSLSSTEIWDPVAPANSAFTDGPTMLATRNQHTATLLADHNVLVAGGWSNSSPFVSAELYRPGTNDFAATGPMVFSRSVHTATLLDDGTVLFAGGETTFSGATQMALRFEIYTPGTGTFADA